MLVPFDDHATAVVTFEVDPSLQVPVAVKACFWPAATVAESGLTEMAVSVAAVTVSEAVPLIAPDVAVTVTAPAVTPVATPAEAAAFDSVATAGSLDAQTASVVTSDDVPSDHAPVAVKPFFAPTEIDADNGATVIPVSTGAVTVRAADPDEPPADAEIVVVPCATPVATPWLPAVLDTVAAAGFVEDQAAVAVMSVVAPFDHVPVAVNACLRPVATEAGAGATETPVSTGAVTVSPAEPVTAPEVATMVVEPTETPVATPWLPGAFDTVADAGVVDVQATSAVAFDVVPSDHVAVAVNGCLSPAATEAVWGTTESDVTTLMVTTSVAEPDTPPDAALTVAVPAATPVATPWLPATFEIVATDAGDANHCAVDVRSAVEPSE